MLQLKLVPVPVCLGIYDVKGVPHRSMPARMRFMHPDAAAAFAKIADWVVVSDMFRTPESSLQAVREGRGAQPPGFSAHNYGLAIDIDIKASMKNIGVRTKTDLDVRMASVGFFCHRRDGKMDHEAWHYNFLGVGARVTGTLTSDEVEQRILQLYGPELSPDDTECQRMMAKMKVYRGEIDGIIGPRSTESVRVIERSWGLPVDGKLDSKTRRTLAYVSADDPV